jgi:gliding motility-associated-like protein
MLPVPSPVQVDFDPGPPVYPLSGSSNSSSPFVLKLSRCTNVTYSSLYINVCDSFVLNNEVFDSSGVYIQVIPNVTGCDSIITLHLSINKKYTQQAKEICQGDLFFAGGGNQSSSGTYIDTLQTVTGCDSIVTTYLTVNPKPSPNLGADRDLCSNTTLTVTPGSFANYLWQDMSNASSFTINSTGLYWVTVINNYNCAATDTIIIRNILQSPANFLKEKDSICSYGNLQLQSTNVYPKYQWSNGSTERKITINAQGMYWLKVTDLNGCSGIDTTIVFTKQCMFGVYIPTAFTPYLDGKNDFFKALVFGKVMSFKLQVYDRAGQLVFQTTNPGEQWDGRYKGMEYSTTVFVWQCFYQLEGQQPGYQKGTVTLIR